MAIAGEVRKGWQRKGVWHGRPQALKFGLQLRSKVSAKGYLPEDRREEALDFAKEAAPGGLDLRWWQGRRLKVRCGRQAT